MQKPYFIAIEGIEGVGKTTLASVIESYLIHKGYDCVLTREPGGTNLAEKVRTLLKDDHYSIDNVTELLLMFAARSHHITQKIKPNLEDGRCVVSDRYVDASYAYQGGGRGVPDSFLMQLDSMVCSDIKPDLTVLITCPVKIAMARVIARNEAIDRIEKEQQSFFERAQEKYLAIAKNNPSYIIIDGNQPFAKVKQDLLDVLANHRLFQ